MLPNIYHPKALPPRLRSGLHYAILDVSEGEADVILLPADSPSQTVAAARSTHLNKMILGYSEEEPTINQRIQWIHMGGDDIGSFAELPILLRRYWGDREGASRLDRFLGEVQGYIEQRDGLSEQLEGNGLARVVELCRRRDVVVGQPEPTLPSSFRYAIELEEPFATGNVIRMTPDVWTVSFPMMLKAKSKVVFKVRGAARDWRVEGEVLRPQGATGGHWVVTVLIKDVEMMEEIPGDEEPTL